ncbi:MAG: endonuclease/exonuclease/phosphatase family protein [Mesorhizobium sp.]|nr:endonuclease/exonuclease/phosphatase family protein [Mesorhizobium sp.]
MKCVTYNIQYGIGLDGRYDLARIAESLRGADVIALQEVCRNNPQNGGHDMVAELRDLLPDYFAVFGPNFDVDMGSHVKDGRAVEVFFQFGNMILSRTPIATSRNLLLPRRRSFGKLNLQRGALEAVIDTPLLGPVRFYSVHLDHRVPEERQRQARFLMDRATGYTIEGGAVTGVSENGFPEPPCPEAYMLLGDFNMAQDSREYAEIAGSPDIFFGMPRIADRAVDAARLLAEASGIEAQYTWLEPRDPENQDYWKRLDYGFVWPGIADRLARSWVDLEADGSDHKPVWFEFA